MQRLNATTLSGGFFLLFWVGLWTYADQLTVNGRGGPISYDPLFFPMLLIQAGAVLSLVVLVTGLMKPQPAFRGSFFGRKIAAAMLIVGAYLLLLKPVGFLLSSVAMILALGSLLGFRRPVVLALVAVGGTALVWVLFTQGLKAPLPTWPEGF